jgi:DNA-binding CsgD family transcriptional regulator
MNILMEAERVDRLTEGQRECLRRVLRHQTSKDIARELGISPHTVDQRLRIAAKTLGVASRIEAARLLALHEDLGPAAYQPAVYQAPDIAGSPASAFVPDVAAGHFPGGQENVGLARERQLAYQAFVPAPQGALPLPPPFSQGTANRLPAWQRIAWMIGLTILCAFAFGALLSGLDALSGLVAAKSGHPSMESPRSRN